MPQNCTHKQQFSETDFPNHLPTSSAKTLNYIHHHILYSSSIQSFRPFYRVGHLCKMFLVKLHHLKI